MILKGNARGGAKGLALHLMKEENEHAELHELRGFASQTLMGALQEAHAISRGTRCKQFLYSLSLNPPETETVSIRDFEKAIERIEEKLDLIDQPRAIVFHEKQGRRHAHCVWSRINVAEMKAVQMSYDHTKLRSLSRELYLEHGWKMPDGLSDTKNRDPRNFTLAQWQQAKRSGQDAREIKTAIQDAWAVSDSREAFAHALSERGFKLARGDRRGFVAVDVHGEVYSIARQAGIKTRDVNARLGAPDALPEVVQASRQFAAEMQMTMDELQRRLIVKTEGYTAGFEARRVELVARQRIERKELADAQKTRSIVEARERQARFRGGLAGLWDRLRGEHRRLQKRNEADAAQAVQRDTQEKDKLVQRHLGERRRLNLFRIKLNRTFQQLTREISEDRERFQQMRDAPDPRLNVIEGQRPRSRNPY